MNEPARNPPVFPEQMLVFQLDEQHYALPLRHIREIHRAVTIAKLPAGPDMVEGIVNVRGELVPVMDLRRRIGLPSRELHPGEYLVRAFAGARTVALRVDDVLGVREVHPDEIQRGSELAPHAPYIAGVVRLADGVLMIHDLERFLTPAEQADLSEALRALAGHQKGG